MTFGRRVARGFGGVARGFSPAILALLATVAAQAQQVTFDRILHADREPQNWLTYSGSLFSHRHSPSRCNGSFRRVVRRNRSRSSKRRRSSSTA